MTPGFSEGYREFRLWTLLELPGETEVWGVYGDSYSYVPDDNEETRASYTERLLRELWSEGFATFVRLEHDDVSQPLTDEELRPLLEVGSGVVA